MRVVIISVYILSLLFILANCTGKKEDSTALSEGLEKAYLAKGEEIVKATFLALSSRLSGALQTGGVTHASQYCNTIALPITDSLSKEHKATIKRTSLLLRNPANEPLDWERGIIAEYGKKLNLGEALTPVIRLLPDNRIGYAAPILMPPMCLQCHGEIGTTLMASNYDLIKKMYPRDKAIGYFEGDLRGIWSITFQMKELD